MNRILITGGTGRLAFELKKHLEGEYVGIEHWDLREAIPVKDYDLIVHMGAYTDVVKAESESRDCFMTNTFGTFNLLQNYANTPVIYISTEYARNPLGVYAKSKRWAEEIVKDHSAPYLILRTSFKPTPFPFPKAYIDQYTQGDSIDIIAEILAKRVKDWDRKTSLFEYLGTGRKTIYEMAIKTRPDVVGNSVDEYNQKIGKNLIPYDYE